MKIHQTFKIAEKCNHNQEKLHNKENLEMKDVMQVVNKGIKTCKTKIYKISITAIKKNMNIMLK